SRGYHVLRGRNGLAQRVCARKQSRHLQLADRRVLIGPYVVDDVQVGVVRASEVEMTAGEQIVGAVRVLNLPVDEAEARTDWHQNLCRRTVDSANAVSGSNRVVALACS